MYIRSERLRPVYVKMKKSVIKTRITTYISESLAHHDVRMQSIFEFNITNSNERIYSMTKYFGDLIQLDLHLYRISYTDVVE